MRYGLLLFNANEDMAALFGCKLLARAADWAWLLEFIERFRLRAIELLLILLRS